ncbi:MAG: SIS domain-containing protein [Candidatus Omnitrophica bacterium]|nr:SIS domain-containing protein [Candidatus Omnitrophota bacterium]
MKNKYFKDLALLFSKIEVSTYSGKALNFDKAIEAIIREITARKNKGNKLIIIGNGGSAAIANHISTDLLKNAHIPAIAFSDSSLITCLSNDLGFEYVFEKPISLLAKKADTLFSISSSGRSNNILRAAKTALKMGCFVVTFSGFDRDNTLRSLGNINFYVPSHSYGYVEITHKAICHYIVDILTRAK